jgi:hypothetical protein
MVNVYVTLAEIPRSKRSKTENIFLVLSVKEQHLKKHGEEVYSSLLADLLLLERGVEVNGRFIKAGVLVYLGDNLELHSVGGFSQE